MLRAAAASRPSLPRTSTDKFGHGPEETKACMVLIFTFKNVHVHHFQHDGSDGLPCTRITKMSCACNCGRGPVSVGAFSFLSFFSHPEPCLKIKIVVGKSDVLRRAPGARERAHPGFKADCIRSIVCRLSRQAPLTRTLGGSSCAPRKLFTAARFCSFAFIGS